MGHKSRLIFSGHIFKGRIWFSGARTGLARDSWQSKVGSFSKELGPDIGGTVCSSQRSGSQFYCWHFELKTFDRQKRITVSTLFPNKPNELVNHVCPWDLLGAAWIGTEVGGAPEDTGWISSKNNHIRREACDIQLKLWCVCVISRAGECDSHSPPPPPESSRAGILEVWSQLVFVLRRSENMISEEELALSSAMESGARKAQIDVAISVI